MQDFGVIITCTKTDSLFAQGCCASIRYFMGDVPICLLVDGTVSVDSIASTYNTLVITKKSVKSELLATRSMGWGLTKMIAFWESPFEHFLLLDADTCVWGDVSLYADFTKYDAIVDLPYYSYTEESINEYFFDTNLLKTLYPDFAYLSHPYVCTGVIFGKRDIFDIAEYEYILNLKDKHPGLFKYGEMGFLNFMLFRAKQEQKLRIGAVHTQHIVTDFSFEETKKRFPLNSVPVVTGDPTVIHWAGGSKPVRSNPHIYSEPMLFFRKKFMKDNGHSSTMANLLINKDEYLRNFYLQSKYYKKRFTQVVK